MAVIGVKLDDLVTDQTQQISSCIYGTHGTGPISTDPSGTPKMSRMMDDLVERRHVLRRTNELGMIETSSVHSHACSYSIRQYRTSQRNVSWSWSTACVKCSRQINHDNLTSAETSPQSAAFRIAVCTCCSACLGGIERLVYAD